MGITTVVVVVVEAVATGAAATGHHPLTITRVGLGGGMIDMIGPDLVPILQWDMGIIDKYKSDEKLLLTFLHI